MIPSLLNNKTIWYILILISYSPGSGYTRKEIKELTKLDNISLDNALKKLISHKIIRKNGRIMKVDFNNIETKFIFDIIDHEKSKLNYPSYDLFIVLFEFVNLIYLKKIDKIFLFGSYAKKIASENSDIDLAIFSEDKVNLITEEEKIEIKFNKKLQLHYFKTNELNGTNKLVKEILKDGVPVL